LAVAAVTTHNAEAMKPSPPATVSCTTTSSSGDLYDVDCAIEFKGPQKPGTVAFIEPPYEIVELLGADVDKDNENLWKIRLRFLLMGEVSLFFKIEYQSGPSIRIGTKYNPFVSAFKAKPPLRGRGKVTVDGEGRTIREYESD
jgi:hypothetical protein